MKSHETIANILFAATVLIFVLLVIFVYLYTTYGQYFREYAAVNLYGPGCVYGEREDENQSIFIDRKAKDQAELTELK